MTSTDPLPKPKDDDEPASIAVETFDALLSGALSAGRPKTHEDEDKPKE